MITRNTPLGGISSRSFLAFLTYIDDVMNTYRRPPSSTSVISSRSSIVPGGSPRSGRRIKGPFFCPSGVSVSSKRASFVLLSQMRKRESAIGTIAEALYSSSPFNSPNGIELIISEVDASRGELLSPVFDPPDPMDFEHPATEPIQSARSRIPAKKSQNDFFVVRWLGGFTRDLIYFLQEPIH